MDVGVGRVSVEGRSVPCASAAEANQAKAIVLSATQAAD